MMRMIRKGKFCGGMQKVECRMVVVVLVLSPCVSEWCIVTSNGCDVGSDDDDSLHRSIYLLFCGE